MIWPWRPQAGLTEALEWKTDVLVANDGSEQRAGLRVAPRQSFEASILLSDSAQISLAQALINYGQGLEWKWPCWHEATRLPSALSAGAASILLDTTTSDYRDDSQAVIWASADSYEVVDISTVSDTGLTLAYPTESTWPAGTEIMPLRAAILSGSARRDDYPAGRMGWTVTMAVTDNIALSTSASVLQYLNQDVLDQPWLFPGETVQRDLSRELDTLDPETGAWATYQRGEYPAQAVQQKWYLKNRAQSWAFRTWLHRRFGRAVPCWVPSWTADLHLTSTPGVASTTIQTADTHWRDYGVTNPAMQHVAIMGNDGSITCRQITGGASGGTGVEVLTLNGAVGTSSIKRISFFGLHRLYADRVELDWQRVGVANVQASMITVAA